jgi:hypothetical protein
MKRVTFAGALVLGLMGTAGWAGLRDADEGQQRTRQSQGQGGVGQTGQEQGQGAMRASGQEWRDCATTLSELEPITELAGTVTHASENLLTLQDATGRSVDLRAGTDTCLMSSNQPLHPSQLSEGTAVRVAYAAEPRTGLTARVVQVIEDQPESQGVGGSGLAGQEQGAPGQEWQDCATALSTLGPTTELAGTVTHASKDLLTLQDTTGQSVNLRSRTNTCVVSSDQPMQPSQLSEGTAVRVAYDVEPQTGLTARVIQVVEDQAEPAPER